MKERKEYKEKSFASVNKKSFISVVVVLMVMVCVAAILSLIIPQGSFERNENGEMKNENVDEQKKKKWM